MFIAQIDFEISRNVEDDEQEQGVYSLLASFLHDGRISEDYQILKSEKLITAFVTIPAEDAFVNFEVNPYIPKFIDELSKVNLLQPKFKVLGKVANFLASCECKDSSSYILYTGTWLSSVTPLYCFDCFKTIPLYRLPRPESGDFFDVYIWKSDYKSCDSLQMHCQTGERFGLREMFDVKSNLTHFGLAICSTVKQLTGKNCYYVLYKYRGKSMKKERERRCPKCNEEWLLEEKLHKLFDFKCDKCNLLSNIADSF
jgi:predicted  nucleic acid-binding Zn ribbon protein